MPDFGANGKLGIQKLVLDKVFDTNKFLAWTIRLKIDRGHNGPCPTINVIPEPDRNKVKVLSFKGVMHLKWKLRICTIQIELEKLGFVSKKIKNFKIFQFSPNARGPPKIFDV